MDLLQILKFLLVGVWNTGFDLALFWVFLNIFSQATFLEKSKIKAPAIAHVCAFLIANSVSYVFNSIFTFSGSNNRGFLPYFIVSCVSLVISTSLVHFLTEKHLYEKGRSFIKQLTKKIVTEKQFALVVKLAVVSVVMVINFVGYKYFVYT